MRNGLVLVGVAFAVALAAVVGNRLSNDAMAVVVGAACGISASIPVIIGLVIATNQNWGRRDEPRVVEPEYQLNRFMPPQPPVVILNPPQASMPYGYSQNQYYLPPTISPDFAPREFKIVGDENGVG